MPPKNRRMDQSPRRIRLPAPYNKDNSPNHDLPSVTPLRRVAPQRPPAIFRAGRGATDWLSRCEILNRAVTPDLELTQRYCSTVAVSEGSLPPDGGFPARARVAGRRSPESPFRQANRILLAGWPIQDCPPELFFRARRPRSTASVVRLRMRRVAPEVGPRKLRSGASRPGSSPPDRQYPR